MSGVYFVRDEHCPDPDKLARVLSAQLVHGDETVNHYAVAAPSVLGLVSHDRLRQGVMPRFLETTGLWGVLDGELHACDALDAARIAHPHAASDLDVLAQLYRTGKLEAALPRLNGAFSFLLWDETSDTLVAANDRYGLYPMYWAQGNGIFCIGSRVVHPVLAGAVRGDWNTAGVAQLFTTDDYLGETTLVSGVETFPQATLLTLQRGEASWKRYWQYDYTPRESTTPLDELGQRLGAGLVRSVERQAKHGRRIGVTLSGGLDSRCLVAAAAAHAGIPLHTFTWAKRNAYDRQFARDVARVYSTQHHDCDYEYLQFHARSDECARATEGLINVFDCHMLAHLHLLTPHADIILNGYAADLLLGGSYLRPEWMHDMPANVLAERLFTWRNGMLRENDLSGVVIGYDALPTDARPSHVFARLVETTDAPSTPDRVDRFFLESRVRRVTSMGTVLMRCGVESAAGFFDYDLLDLITGVPATLRQEHCAYRAMMQASFPEALRIRYQRTLLPADAPTWAAVASKAFLKGCRMLDARLGWPHIARRQSPVDFAQWLRGPLKPWMDGLVRTQNPTANEAILPAFCGRIWDEHLQGQDRTRLLGAVAAVRAFAATLARARQTAPATSTEPQRIAR